MMLTVIYYIICYSHGDFSPEHLGKADWLPCIAETDGFASIFLFSLETQHTIGYGTRQTTTECPTAMIIVSLQVKWIRVKSDYNVTELWTEKFSGKK